MGYDAYATKDGEVIWLPQPVNGTLATVSPELASIQHAFDQADKKLRQITDTGGLADAWVSSGKREFTRATAHTGLKCYDPDNVLGQIDWTPDEVLFVQAQADWDFEPSPNEDFGLAFSWYWQARLFLETCAQQGLGIRFTW